MQNVKIIRMTNKDVDEVFELEKLIHPEHHWSKNSFYNELANNLALYFIIQNEAGKIIAYIGFWQIFEEAHITTL